MLPRMLEPHVVVNKKVILSREGKKKCNFKSWFHSSSSDLTRDPLGFIFPVRVTDKLFVSAAALFVTNKQME